MNFLIRLKAIDRVDKVKAVDKLVEDATFDFDFVYMTILSVLMASFGLLAGSETVVIGSMLLAPVMSPILALALGLSMSNHSLITRSLKSLVHTTIIAVVASVGATLLFSFTGGDIAKNVVILSRTHPSLMFLAVAIIAGLAASYTVAQPKLSSNLTGVAVAVALVPPLAVIGIGVADFNLAVASGAFVMYLINITGIVFAAMFSFSLMDMHDDKSRATTKIKREEKRVEGENKKIESIKQSDKIDYDLEKSDVYVSDSNLGNKV